MEADQDQPHSNALFELEQVPGPLWAPFSHLLSE